MPISLLAIMLAVAAVLELTVLRSPSPVWQLWLPKAPLAFLLVLPWLRR